MAKGSRRNVVLTGALGAGLLCGGVACAATETVLRDGQIVREDGSAENLPAPVYSVNAHGETFGSSADARVPGEEPDLIEAYATNGRIGYVRKAHLEAGEPQTLEAVREAMRAGEASRQREIPVYESDGETVIGVVTVGDGSMSFESSSVEERSGN